ncbi:MAG: VWA domain-containing protein [Actinobacteria bacterium]|nr:VWA domain-containing protein [Actinomycetota bacterium]MBW3642518.1 VWA domain-containing protein [Actinomycetota bacterium]
MTALGVPPLGEGTAAPGGAQLVGALVAFSRELRHEGLVVGPGQALDFARAVATLDPSALADVYWAGRACLVARRQDHAAYDRAFRRCFAGDPGPALTITGALPRGGLTLATAMPVAAPAPASRAADEDEEEEGERLGARASSAEVLRTKDFAQCTAEELADLQVLMTRLVLSLPERRSRRSMPASRGHQLDLRRTIRRSLKSQGELVHRSWRTPRRRHRRLVLLLDVSASMASYSRALLQFAYSAMSAARAPTEVFCFGTRLTRVTPALRHRRPDHALARATESVVDWEGGTRIGDSLAEFNRTWGRRGTARGAVVVVCSDGLERGDPSALATEMARLGRLAHRVVWLNPLKGDPRYQPLARGMSAALPFVDVFLAGHDLSSLEALAALLPELT